MDILKLLVGKKVKILTDMKIEVELEIQSVKKNSHSQDLEKATRENDWWPASRDWTTYTVTFTNGASKTYDSIEQINVIE